MKHLIVWGLGLTVGICLFVRLAVPGEAPAPRKVAPLSLDGLLDEKLPADSNMSPAGSGYVDNSACYVCHTNYEQEELVTVHATEDVGCITCHGESVAHRNDEDNITPPDTLYARDYVDRMCTECHEQHDVSPYDVLRRWQERCASVPAPEDIVCTDCHFQHRLAHRTVQWDKKTRQLIRRATEAEASGP
jgi:hypothetical protein